MKKEVLDEWSAIRKWEIKIVTNFRVARDSGAIP
jgi:hypothetical protein